MLLEQDAPVDPNEPVYCTCHRVAFGGMIGCDNDDCEVEWFHFACVGLTEQVRPPCGAMDVAIVDVVLRECSPRGLGTAPTAKLRWSRSRRSGEEGGRGVDFRITISRDKSYA